MGMSLTASLVLLCALGARPEPQIIECGNDKSCTMKDWMRLTVRPHLDNEDYARLAVALRRLSNGAPAEQTEWRKIARLAAIEAERKNADGVRQQCRACHGLYRRASRPHP